MAGVTYAISEMAADITEAYGYTLNRRELAKGWKAALPVALGSAGRYYLKRYLVQLWPGYGTAIAAVVGAKAGQLFAKHVGGGWIGLCEAAVRKGLAPGSDVLEGEAARALGIVLSGLPPADAFDEQQGRELAEDGQLDLST